MNDKICDAVRKAIDTHGLDVLKSPKFTNVLLDYGAFDVHDREMPIRKEPDAQTRIDLRGEGRPEGEDHGTDRFLREKRAVPAFQ